MGQLNLKNTLPEILQNMKRFCISVRIKQINKIEFVCTFLHDPVYF